MMFDHSCSRSAYNDNQKDKQLRIAVRKKGFDFGMYAILLYSKAQLPGEVLGLQADIAAACPR